MSNLDLKVKKTILISRHIFWSCLAFFLLAGVLSVVADLFDLKWLTYLVTFIGGISIILFVISTIMPGILIFLGVPWLARAWHRGLNPIAVSGTSWEQLSIWQKLLTYIWSIILSGFTVFAIIGLILQAR